MNEESKMLIKKRIKEEKIELKILETEELKQKKYIKETKEYIKMLEEIIA